MADDVKKVEIVKVSAGTKATITLVGATLVGIAGMLGYNFCDCECAEVLPPPPAAAPAIEQAPAQ